jgi:hypothetical protein
MMMTMTEDLPLLGQLSIVHHEVSFHIQEIIIQSTVCRLIRD